MAPCGPMASSARKHLVLLGDSILDNKTYTRAGRCVTEHLRAKLSADEWQVTNCAIDGDVISGIYAQLHHVPADATAIVLSVGGNDGLRMLGANFEQSMHGHPT